MILDLISFCITVLQYVFDVFGIIISRFNLLDFHFFGFLLSFYYYFLLYYLLIKKRQMEPGAIAEAAVEGKL